MPTIPLPQDPNLEQLRRKARDLQRAVRTGKADALDAVVEHHPSPPNAAAFPLSAAQLVVARQYGFVSWARLRLHVDVVTARSWNPTAAPPDEAVADQFLRLVCLTYSDDGPVDRSAAETLLATDPDVVSRNIWVAAACASADDVARLLASDPALASAVGGPHSWSPLLYQAYARHDPDVSWDDTRRTAELLLEAGADPNDGRFWHGMPTPFTVLTGVFGSGERDEPWHPHADAFARLLLDAGADPNDGQAIYDRMFGDNDDHLVLLFEYGLGQDTNGPWHRLVGDAIAAPAVMLRELLEWAVTHDQRPRVALLASHGVDVISPFTNARQQSINGRTPIEVALLNGHQILADQLRVLGAQPPVLNAGEEFVSAILTGDAVAVRAADATVVDEVRRTRPGLVVWAAANGAPTAVELLVESGFDINARGRSDVPIEQRWHTALHVAAGDGNVELAQRLLALGADPTAIDERFKATPLGWARYFGHDELVDLLESATN